MRDEAGAAGAGVGVGAETGAGVGADCDSGCDSVCASGREVVLGCTSVVAATGASVDSAIVTSAVSIVAVSPFVMGVGSVCAICDAPSGAGSAMMYFRLRVRSLRLARRSRTRREVRSCFAVSWSFVKVAL